MQHQSRMSSSMNRDFYSLQQQMNQLFSDFQRRSRMFDDPFSDSFFDEFQSDPFFSGVWGNGQQQLGSGQQQQQLTSGKPQEETKEPDNRVSTTGHQQKGSNNNQTMTNYNNNQNQNQMMSMFNPSMGLRTMATRIDVQDCKDKYLVTADLPGFTTGDVRVHEQDGMLTIEAKHKQEDEQKDKNYVRKERHYSHVSRSIKLPKGVDTSRITANLNDGVLSIDVPKT
jgi:HSP20 family molecular chaperone IbpA